MHVFSVADFLTYVNETFRAVWDPQAACLEGEVSEFRVSQGQWVNFNLKDADATVSVFMVLRNLAFPVEDGMRVRLYGMPRVYAKYGKFSFSADRVEPVGEGALKKALAALRSKLAAEGLFDPSRKRELPRFPKRVALIASRESAAYGDFVRILNERWSGLELDAYHAIVQGEKAPESVMRAIESAHANGPYDVLVITRGGGSFEELMAFNDEHLVRAIFASKIPTLVAIGHERDVTLAEEAADVRGSTPTDCARRLVPDKRDILYEIATLEQGIADALEEHIYDGKLRMERAITGAERWALLVRQRADGVSSRAYDGFFTWKRHMSDRVDGLLRLVRSFNPEAVIRRGFAIVSAEDGSIITSKTKAKTGNRVNIRLRDGSFGARIEGEQASLL